MPIEFQKIQAAELQQPNPQAVHRYRGSRPWSVAAMAAVASAGALGLTGALSAMVSGIAVEQRERLGEEIRELTAPAKRPANLPLPPATVPDPVQPSTPVLPTATAADWQLQIGSFRNEAAAVAQLRSATMRLPELGGYALRTEPYRGNSRARIGGIEDAERARVLCAKVRAAGSACFVVRPAS